MTDALETNLASHPVFATIGVDTLLKMGSCARAASYVRATAFDATCLCRLCEEDLEFGFGLMKRVAGVMVERLQHTRLQLVDLYGTPS